MSVTNKTQVIARLTADNVALQAKIEGLNQEVARLIDLLGKENANTENWGLEELKKIMNLPELGFPTNKTMKDLLEFIRERLRSQTGKR